MIRSMIFSRPGLKSTTENMLHVWKKQLTTCYQHSCKGETSWEIQHYEMIFYSVNYNFGTFCSPWRWKKQFLVFNTKIWIKIYSFVSRSIYIIITNWQYFSCIDLPYSLHWKCCIFDHNCSDSTSYHENTTPIPKKTKPILTISMTWKEQYRALK